MPRLNFRYYSFELTWLSLRHFCIGCYYGQRFVRHSTTFDAEPIPRFLVWSPFPWYPPYSVSLGNSHCRQLPFSIRPYRLWLGLGRAIFGFTRQFKFPSRVNSYHNREPQLTLGSVSSSELIGVLWSVVYVYAANDVVDNRLIIWGIATSHCHNISIDHIDPVNRASTDKTTL